MDLTRQPYVLLILSLVVLYLGAEIGNLLRFKPLAEDERDDYTIVIGATLTLLGLLVGFVFSMAISRYDQRKNYEEAEANAIGTEYVRLDFLPAEEAEKGRALLKKYLNLRIQYYTTPRGEALTSINDETAAVQNELWDLMRPLGERPNPVVALVVSGMNDVLNSQGYTQASWRNRIPHAAWLLMSCIAAFCNFLIGFGSRRVDRRLFVILPLAVSVAFFLISDIDTPRGGAITVAPQNLISLQQSLK